MEGTQQDFGFEDESQQVQIPGQPPAAGYSSKRPQTSHGRGRKPGAQLQGLRKREEKESGLGDTSGAVEIAK